MPKNKSVLSFFVAWIAGVSYLLFQYFNPALFSSSADFFEELGLARILVLFSLFMLCIMVLPSSTYHFLSKPLWGVEKTASGYKDMSVERHPYIVGVLMFIGVVSATYIFFLSR
ncbi:MAG: hypothetical protein AAB947_01390 [Patescibacteria group bacterium]